MPRVLSTLVALVLLVAVPAAPAQFDTLLESLEPIGHLNDFAGVAGGQAAEIEALLRELEEKTGAQVAVVTVASLEGGEINDFAVRLFERWGIGGAQEDNGVLLLASIGDRDVRIEVGYGLEGVINDAMAGRILDQAVLGYFRDGDYPSGLASGAATIAAVIADEAGVELTGAPQVRAQAQGNSSRSFGWVRILFLLLLLPVLWRNPWLFLLLMSGGRGGGYGGGGGFGRGGGGGFGGFGGGMSGGGGASRSW